jgi:tetratricopeptide (TPR) repeat protein/serine/threonine protein kinase
MDEEAVFTTALAMESADQRAAYLDAACAGHADLRRKVEELLSAHARAGPFLDNAAAAWNARLPTGDRQPIAEAAGTVIGPYKLLEQIGEGGMGLVFVAEQQQPVRRKVALKVIKPGMDSRQVIARFEAERQALALMDHPHIARVLDAGETTSGRPYFVMELVRGVPVTQFCDENRLTTRARLELFVSVCQAVQHAHQKGVIHRDLKPSNVLVASYDGRPVVKVIDFGVAKAMGQQLTERTLFTGFGGIVGTLEYMSPEQAEVNALDIDTRSDVYALGVLLYELLTGTTPLTKQRLKEAPLTEVLRLIREEEPPKPSTRLTDSKDNLPSIAAQRQMEPAKLTKLVRGELDWLVMKALEKERSRRYETANGFARDVQRYLADEPVEACPPSVAYKLRKFARKHKRVLATAAAFAVLLLLAGGSGLWLAQQRAKTAEAATEALAKAAELQGEGKAPEALAAAQHAEALLRLGGGSADLRRRVRERRRDLEMAVLLEDIRLEQTSVKDDHFDSAGADPLYAEAFRDYGIDVEALDPAEAAERIQARSIAAELITALDNWAWIRKRARKGDPASWERLLAVARAADPDPLRNQLRDVLEGKAQLTPEQAVAATRSTGLREHAAHHLGDLLRNAGAGEQAVTVLRQAQRQYPGDFWINNELGSCLLYLKPPQLDEAIRFYTAAVVIRPQSPGAHFNLGHALGHKGAWDEAIQEFREALRLKPDYSGAHLGLGRALEAKGQLDEAIREDREALRLRPDNPVARANLGIALRRKGQLDEAIREYREALHLRPDYPEARTNLGIVLAQKQQLDEAMGEYREALRLQPDFPQAYNAHLGLGRALLTKGQVDEAIWEYREALRFKPDFPEAHFGLGTALGRKGQHDEAIQELREALHLRPDYPQARANLGSGLSEKGHLEEAIREFREVLRSKRAFPDAHIAHNNFGTALGRKGQLDEAIGEFRKALRLRPDYPKAHYNLGRALRLKGQLREALASFRRAHELDRKYAQYVRKTERLIELDGRLPAILRGEAQPADATERIELAELCYYKNLFGTSARLFEEAFAAKPELTEDQEASHRYFAACSAVLAGCGRGNDDPPLDETARARWRRQALDWLRADLLQWSTHLASKTPAASALVQKKLRHWQQDPDLTELREPAALAKLSEAEQRVCRQLWDDVAALLEQAHKLEQPPEPTKSGAKEGPPEKP